MAGYKALMSMALNGRHELLSLLLQTGITSAQHALLLLESVIQKKGKAAIIEKVVAEMLQYIGPQTKEAGSVIKVAAGHSCAAVVAMLLDWSHCKKPTLDLQLVGVALAEACDSNNDDVTQLLLKTWQGTCTALQAQPLLRAFAARGDATTVSRLLAMGKGAMVRLDAKERAQLASTGLAHAAGEKAQRAKVLSTLLAAGAEPRGGFGEAALRNAARDGQAESMQLLLAVGTNVNAVDEDGKTVLCVAACSGCCDGVKCLLKHGAQVRMRCHDGREPLDFAVDESVRKLLLAEVEKLRMGLLDELLADEDDAKGKKGGKAAKKAAKKGKDPKAEGGAPAAPAEPAAEAAEANGVPSAPSKNAKKKQKKAASKAAASSVPGEGGDADGDASAATATVVEAVESGGERGAARTSPKKKGAEANGGAAHGEERSASLLDAAVRVLSGQAEGGAMRISSLVSALYDVSASFKDEIKHAGGAKHWLREHPDAFDVTVDCPPGHESVTLRGQKHADATGTGEAHNGQHANGTAASDGGSGREGSGAKAHRDSEAAGLPVASGESAGACHSEGSDDAEPPPPRRFAASLPRSTTCPVADFGELPWHAADQMTAAEADDLAAAALLNAGSEENTSDPLLIEKKIRAVQKKLRRVQVIEDLISQGTALDHGQQALLSSKTRLQAQLHHLLQQWAVLEPVLLEQQEQRMLAIANSECAICLEEYDASTPGIRTSCCGAARLATAHPRATRRPRTALPFPPSFPRWPLLAARVAPQRARPSPARRVALTRSQGTTFTGAACNSASTRRGSVRFARPARGCAR